MEDFFIKSDGKFIRFDVRDIRYVEGMKNYVKIFTTTRFYIVLISLRQLEKELPAELFCKVHKSYLVSMAHIQSFDPELVYMEGAVIPVSLVYRNNLQKRVRVLVSDTRNKVTNDA
jgi:two-component system, LytTR family, response regulator